MCDPGDRAETYQNMRKAVSANASLDEARAKEARRRCEALDTNPVTLAARLAREGWTPLDAEIAALRTSDVGTKAKTDALIRRALERGIEIGREQSARTTGAA